MDQDRFKIRIPQTAAEGEGLEKNNEVTAQASLVNSLTILFQSISESLDEIAGTLSWMEQSLFRQAREQGLYTPDEIELHEKEINPEEDEENECAP